MKTTILLILLTAALCFSQTPVTEIYIYQYGNHATVETFTWGEDRSEVTEYYFHNYDGHSLYQRSPNYHRYDLGWLVFEKEMFEDNDCEDDYLYEYEDDYK